MGLNFVSKTVSNLGWLINKLEANTINGNKTFNRC